MIKRPEENNVVWHKTLVNRADREKLSGHKGVNLWFTGLSSSGKSTVAHALEKKLYDLGCRTYVFDGDNVRHGLCADLSFSIDARSENIRRIGEMVKLFLDTGVIAITAFISPLRKDRQRVRELLGEDDFLEIYCQCPVEVCEERDPKGLYRRARAGEIENYTGVSSPYEEPEDPALVLDTVNTSIEDNVEAVIQMLIGRGIIPPPVTVA